MRKLVYLVIVVLFAQISVAQTTSPTMKPYASLKAALIKMENAVQEPKEADYPDAKKFAKAKAKYQKKVNNPSTWFNLGEAYREIYTYAGADIGYGANLQTVMILKGMPKEKATIENKEIWDYEDFKLYFEDGKVKKWEVKDEFPDATKKAIKAYKQAIDKDTKGAIKKKSQEALVELRNYLRDEGVMFYFDQQLERALADYKCSSKIYEMPQMAGTDTTNYNISEVYYYGAAFAEGNKDYENAIYFYNKNIEYCKTAPEAQQMEFVKSYRYLANDYKTLNKKEDFENTLMEAYKQFPEDKDILIDLTQFYLDGGNSQKALEFLNKALEKDPSNYLYVFVRGTLYDSFKTKVYNKMDLLRDDVYNADTARQKGKMTRTAFKNLRASKVKEVNALWPEADKEMNMAMEEYNKALELNPEYFNAKFNLGAVLYNKGAQVIKLADLIPTSDMKAYDAELAKAKDLFSKALPFLEEAVVIEPDNLDVLRTLSTVYAKLGNYDKVKEIKERIVEAEAKKSSEIK